LRCWEVVPGEDKEKFKHGVTFVEEGGIPWQVLLSLSLACLTIILEPYWCGGLYECEEFYNLVIKSQCGSGSQRCNLH
jgi:hypothetical protein